MSVAVPAEVARREIARVYDGSLRPVRADLERATREVADAAQSLGVTVGQARSRREQRAWTSRIAAVAAAAGLAAFPLLAFPLARALPIGDLPDRLATSALGTEPWMAGASLMIRADPGRWNDLIEGYTAARSAGGDFAACYQAARKAGREQRCSVTVRPTPTP